MKKLVACVLAGALAVSGFASTAASGSLTGSVLAGPGLPSPVAVWVASGGAGTPPVRSIVREDGSFRIDGLAAGPAAIAVETAEGLFEVVTPVSIAPGTTRSVQVAIKGRQDSKPEDEEERKALGLWDNPLTATLAVVGGAILVGLLVDQLTDDDESPTASPSTLE